MRSQSERILHQFLVHSNVLPSSSRFSSWVEELRDDTSFGNSSDDDGSTAIDHWANDH